MAAKHSPTSRYASVLDHEVRRIARAVGAPVVAGYLDVPDERLIRMTVVTGVPTSRAVPWARVARAASVPVADTVRTGRLLWLPDQQELARRYSRTALSFPYPVALCTAPLIENGTCWGAVLILWPSVRAPELSADELREIEAACLRAARGLRRAAEAGRPVRPRPEPYALAPPLPRQSDRLAEIMDRLPGGVCALDLEGLVTFVNDGASELLAAAPRDLLHRPLFESLPWLADPGFENAYLATLFSRLPARFSARRPDGRWLSFALQADDTGVTVRIRPADMPVGDELTATEAPSGARVRAGAMFHLLHLASAFTQAVTTREVTESISEQMMPVLGAQGFALLTADEGRLRVISSHGFPTRMPEYFDGLPLATRTEGIRIIEKGVASFHPDSGTLRHTYPAVELYADMVAFAYLPLIVSGRTIGCIVLGYDRRRDFPDEERAELTSLAGIIAQAFERARLYDANTRAARVLQAGLLPGTLPRFEGLGAEARYRPATSTLDVGGDFYDLIRLDDTTAGAVIGDVQGHSVQAAALMGQVRTAMHTHAQAGSSPAEVLARTNKFLGDLSTGLFTSCLYAEFDLRRQRALVSVAGHPPPILRRPDGTTEVLDLPPGLLLGIENDATFHTTEIALAPGSLLALYTDGLVERPGLDLGCAITDLAGCLAGAPPQALGELCDSLVRRAEQTVTEGNGDDIALLLLEVSRRAGG